MDLQNILHCMKCTLHVAFVVLTNLYCIPTYLFWMWGFLLPFRLMNHPGYWYLEGIMYRWLLTMVASWSWKSEFHIVETGCDINTIENDRCLFLVNHQSTADVPLLMLAFHQKGSVLDSIMWVMDRMFRYTNFGLVSVTHGDHFITTGKQYRDQQSVKLKDQLVNVYLTRNRKWIILFPEGGFLCKRKEASTSYAIKNNFPLHEHVTLPKMGAMEVIMNTLRPGDNLNEILDHEVSLVRGTEEERLPVKWVVDLTIAYPEANKPLDLLAICASSRPKCTTYLHYRKYPVADVPLNSGESLRDWVFDRWSEKENILKEYYSSGKFIPEGGDGAMCRRVQMSLLRVLFVHLFFIVSTLLHCCLLRNAWNLLW